MMAPTGDHLAGLNGAVGVVRCRYRFRHRHLPHVAGARIADVAVVENQILVGRGLTDDGGAILRDDVVNVVAGWDRSIRARHSAGPRNDHRRLYALDTLEARPQFVMLLGVRRVVPHKRDDAIVWDRGA